MAPGIASDAVSTSGERPTRVLVVTDTARPSPGLKAAIASRAAAGNVRFRVIVLNPARAELHLLHVERHDLADEAERALLTALPELEACAGHAVIASVSIRHNPMDAIEETLFNEPVDEILLSVPQHGLAMRFHQDLEHRLRHHRLPIAVVWPASHD